MNLYDYKRSSAAYRVRIALNIKDLSYNAIPVNLLNNEHRLADYEAVNPQGLVPSLTLENGGVLTQSMAIIEWLEHNHSEPSLLPGNSERQANIRAAANVIACDIHPLNNLRVLNYLVEQLGVDETAKFDWYRHWINEGFVALEQLLPVGTYAFGDVITLVDVYLVPQVFNALRFDTDMTPYPHLLAAYGNCNKLEPFIKAAPDFAVLHAGNPSTPERLN